jgi:gamma-glutamyltranspeptidase / glutathione hydrolase
MNHRFDWDASYSTPRRPVFARNVVSTSHPLAAQAGLRMLPPAATPSMPHRHRRGDDHRRALQQRPGLRRLLHPVGRQQLHGLNASGTAPAAWTPEYFRRKYGDAKPRRRKRGWDSGHRARRGGRPGWR